MTFISVDFPEPDVAEFASRLVVLRDGLVTKDERRTARIARPVPAVEEAVP